MARSIVISSGHGAHISGAVDIINEHQEAVQVVNRVAAYLNSAGIKVYPFEDTTSRDQNTNLHTIVNYHNSKTRDLDVSVHFDSDGHTSGPLGASCLWTTQEQLSEQVAAAISGASGLKNRGADYRPELYFLAHTEMPAILIETCFVTSETDVELYKNHFDAIAHAIAETIAGVKIPIEGPAPPEPEPEPEPGAKDRPVIGRGDYGHNVREVQATLVITADGDFGPATEQAVTNFQAVNDLSVDGVVGANTWSALVRQGNLSSYPPPLPKLFSDNQINSIRDLARASPIASYSWRDRGQAPAGYTAGMAVAYAQAYVRLIDNADPIAVEQIGRAHV